MSFVIYALPRSMTTWLTKFLSYQSWKCHHDQTMHCSSLAELARFLDTPNVGICETALGFGALAMRRLNRNARVCVIRRPRAEVAASLEAFGLVVNDDLLKEQEMLLERASLIDGALTVTFSELNTEDGCKKVFEHCLGLPFDRDHWLAFKDVNIQCDLFSSFTAGSNHKPVLEQMKVEAATVMQPPSFQNESWDILFSEGRQLFDEHYAEAGTVDNLAYNPDFNYIAMAYRLGMLQITTARNHAGELVGYLGCQVEYNVESKDNKRGVQLPWYIRKEYRGHGRRMHAFMIRSLREKGVKNVSLRAGVRARGPQLASLYRRLGARADGQVFNLPLGDL